MGATIEATLVCATLVFLVSMPKFQFSEAVGFTVDLIHKNSLQFPSLYSSFEHVQMSLKRSFNRAKTLTRSADHSNITTSTDVIPDDGEYLMKISLGTPPNETLAIADTGSDLIWVQCEPCPDCFKQKAPLFDLIRSSTYKAVSCDSDTCNALDITSCDTTKNTCNYNVGYGDASYSNGELATETISFGSAKIPNLIIGCGHDDAGTFGENTSGIVGLGGGKASLITQLKPEIQGKFSYCLVPIPGSENLGTSKNSRTSKMNFGDIAVVSGDDVVKTPIVPKDPDTFYYLTLEGVSVGGRRLNASGENDSDSTEGNIIIDSGTTLTFLPPDLCSEVEAEVKTLMNKSREISDPANILNLCYEPTTVETENGLPPITVHFKGADLEMKPDNVFIKTTNASLCLAFVPGPDVNIYGNLAQMGFLIGYDLEEMTLSFKATDCTKPT